MGTHRQPAALCHFLCSNFYFYPLDMIPIVSRQPQRLNGLVKPPWRTPLCSRLGGGGGEGGGCQELPFSQDHWDFSLSVLL